MESMKSNSSGKLNQADLLKAGELLFESFKNGDAFTEYSLEGVEPEVKMQIIKEYYRRIAIFYNTIHGIKINKKDGEIVSVGTFIPHNSSSTILKDAERISQLHTTGVLTLILNGSIGNIFGKMRTVKRLGLD